MFAFSHGTILGMCKSMACSILCFPTVDVDYTLEHVLHAWFYLARNTTFYVSLLLFVLRAACSWSLLRVINNICMWQIVRECVDQRPCMCRWFVQTWTCICFKAMLQYTNQCYVCVCAFLLFGCANYIAAQSFSASCGWTKICISQNMDMYCSSELRCMCTKMCPVNTPCMRCTYVLHH